MSRPTNVSTTQQLNGTPNSRRTQHEPTLTLQLTGTPVQMSSRRSKPNLSRAHHITNFGSTNWMHALLCKLNYLLTRRSNVHRDHNTSPLRESNSSCHTLLPKIRENGVATRVGDVYTRGKYLPYTR